MPMRSIFLVPVALALVATSPADQKKPAATFAKEGVAFLEQHCVRCHGEKTKKADLALHGFRDDQSLLKQRKLWQGVVNAVKSGEMPPQTRPRPAMAEVDTFLSTVRGVFDHADRNAKPDPGRVTVRRLNRAEYNNTIRDLVGVDFNPAEDFPSDDVGHGFDNIGDVLTLPPLLMERYLSAAEGIMQRAITPDPPKPPRRPVIARFLEPAQSGEITWRPIDQGRGGMLHTLFNLTMDGEYTFRVRAYGESPDAEPPRIALKIDGVELKTFDVKETEKKKGRVFEVGTTLKRGGRRGQVTVVNPKTGDGKERKVFVESFGLVGPADTRPDSHRRLLAATAGKSKQEQTREVLSRVVSRAYRRPATAQEIDRLVALADKQGGRWEEGVQFAMLAVLVSPKFLFRVELDDRPTEAKPHPVDEYQLASRLSYFLWSSMPDDELFSLAAKKQLAANLDAQVRRMLKDPKADALVENFALQWLQLRRLRGHSADPKLFPTFNDALRAAMLKETELFFREIVREDRSVLDLIDGKYTYVNRLLARHYGIENKLPPEPERGFGRRRGGRGQRGGEFVRVDLSDTDRAGILTHASVLTVSSNPTRTSPVKRGKWVLEQLLGTPPPPPPPDVPELDDKKELTGTLRQQMEQHRKNPACANCHAKMDPLGFAFENYDAVGRFRKQDGKFAIDASGVLPDGKAFNGPKELRTILTEKKDLVARCLAEKMLTYALGRGLEHYDNPSLDAITAGLAKNDYRFSALVTEIVKSFPFRMRRGTETP